MAEYSTAPYVLILDASEGLLQFVIAGDENECLTLLCAESWHAPSQGAELLAPALQHALERLKLTPKDIGRIACVRGPGSFTGLRLVLATASGLARATTALQAGMDYLPLLALGAMEGLSDLRETGAPLWVLTHARRQLVHLQGFVADREVQPLTDILVCSPDEGAAVIAAHAAASRPLLLGSGTSRNRQALEDAFARLGAHNPVFLPPSYNHPSPQTLLRAAARLAYTGEDIAPLYARPSDAEENLESIAASLGLDPAQAREKLARLTGR